MLLRILKNEEPTMNRNSISEKLRWCVPAIVLGATLLLLSHSGWMANSAYAQDQEGAPAQAGGRGGRAITPADIPLMPPDRQMAMKIKGSFDLVGVGDLIFRTPLASI